MASKVLGNSLKIWGLASLRYRAPFREWATRSFDLVLQDLFNMPCATGSVGWAMYLYIALALAEDFLDRLRGDARFSDAFKICIDSLLAHVNGARGKIQRLG